MNSAHIHLVVTHLPIFGTFFGIFILLYGMIKKNIDAKLISYGIFIISAVGAGIAYATGEEAEEIVEELPGVMESIIDKHEQFATYSLIGIIVLGVVALAGILTSKGSCLFNKWTTLSAFSIGMICFLLFARTGYLGGQIRHTEVRNGAIIQQSGHGEQGEKEDD